MSIDPTKITDPIQEYHMNGEPKTRRWTDTLLDTMRAIAREEVAKALTERENPQKHRVRMEKLREAVFQALGHASMCWSEQPKGIFDGKEATRAGEELMKAIEHELYDTAELSLPGPNAPSTYKQMPNPTAEQVEHDPLFNAIWSVIKSWDVNVPEYYSGYCGANGSHVVLIMDAITHLEEKEK